MKISVITVCFNAVQTLEQTITSVLSQDYPDFEYIVVDGGSKDGTVALLERYADKIRYISEKDNGIYDAMNKGVRLASGEVIGVIGADDFYPDVQVLSRVAKGFTEVDTDSVYGDVKFVDPLDTEKVVRFWKDAPYDKANWLKGWMPPHVAFFLKKSAYEKYGLYHTEFTCSGDYELMLRMLYKNDLKAHYIPATLMTMRVGGTSSASLKHRWVANQEDRKAWRMNNLKPKWYTLWLKPISKIKQLFMKG
ncbi:glycosyltransferase family 2 protein [Leadbetterella byssophila]|jgi:glycosyltransferase involved in cell wall biosynthesis|uniref:Glycosyl transferase family 2 n=1 Tax=Leadbetterella byssophila (strain DSM 17132 / JCM 16389 / KACC 11308 / NBRC 106382 / 4M15) TaxID=649349 RepID=E4RUM5_LEAB4|nr:glycosyltransferase family 2 protein [Leadbetterella byssophila]ADQ18761.1 glycosyl transferase family 2 [Leadbetterella byssophila DSM 17132]